MSTTPELRIGVLGAARIAPHALIRPAREVPGVTVAAMAARDLARARAFAERHGIPRVHPSYPAVLEDREVDAIYLPLPNSLHAFWSLAALKAGKHVLCEKPMAANAQEAGRVANAAADSGLVMAEAFHYRYHPLATRLKEIVSSGELGTIRHLEAHLCLPAWRPGHIAFRFDLAGGAMMDLGCYPVNLLRYLAGQEPRVVSAQARLSAPNVDRCMAASFLFPDGITARMTCSLWSWVLIRTSALIQGDRGEVRVWNPFQPHLFHRMVVRTEGGTRRERFHRRTTFSYQLQAFAQAVRGGAPMATSAADAASNLRVIEAIYAQAGLSRRGN